MDHAVGEQVLGLGRVGRHVRRGRVRLERIDALPLLDDDEAVGTELGLDLEVARRVDRGAVLDAALFGAHGGNVGAEGFENGLALAGFGGDDGDDVDHESSLLGRGVDCIALEPTRQASARCACRSARPSSLSS